MTLKYLCTIIFMGLLLSACGGETDSELGASEPVVSEPTETYSVMGSVTGLNGSITLSRVDGTQPQVFTQNGAITFDQPVLQSGDYEVVIAEQPAGQVCEITSNSEPASISIVVTCTNNSVYYQPFGNVTGLTGSIDLTLKSVSLNDSEQQQSLIQNGNFTFSQSLLEGSHYTVTIDGQPAGQICTVSNGTGTASASMASIDVVCVVLYSVVGSINGLSDSLTLSLNSGEQQQVFTQNGSFSFTEALLADRDYTVIITSQPVGQSCTVANDSGKVSESMRSIEVTCTNNAVYYSVPGNVTGLTGSIDLILKSVSLNDSEQQQSLNQNGGFTFPQSLLEGSNYTVTIDSQPTGQTCAVTNSTGTVSGSMVSIEVTCTNNVYHKPFGSITGIDGNVSLKLVSVGLTNSEQNLGLNQDGTFTFLQPLLAGSEYTVTIYSQPSKQTCEVANHTGTVSAAMVSITITCDYSNYYDVAGTINGLNDSLTLSLNSGEQQQAFTQNGSFSFTQALPADRDYAVIITSQPVGQHCSVTNDSGKVSESMASIVISCVDYTAHYDVVGAINGLSGSISLSLNDDSQQQTFIQNGDFAFTESLLEGGDYTVTIAAQPAGQFCDISHNSGTVGSAMTPIAIICADTYNIAGNISGIDGSINLLLNSRLLNTGTEQSQAFNTNGVFTFTSALPVGSRYKVNIERHPVGQYCDIVNHAGTITAAMTPIEINCALTPAPSINSVSPPILHSGTEVKVSGNYLEQVTLVVNGETIVPTEQSINELRFVAPALVTGTYQLELESLGGDTQHDLNYSDLLSAVISFSAGDTHSCAVIDGGSVFCWGDNYFGQLGNGTDVNSAELVRVNDIIDAVSVVTGNGHSCAVLSTGSVQCWGKNSSGQLGDGTKVVSFTPVTVVGLSDVATMVAGWNHSCARSNDNKVLCWGENAQGQLGDGTGVTSTTPVAVSGITSALSISSGSNHTCVLLSNDNVSCWGYNAKGQLGDNSTVTPLIPVTVTGISDVASITLGRYFSCVLLNDGGVSCWGDNTWGQLGNGSTNNTPTLIPAPVNDLANVVSVSAGFEHSCAVLNTGRVWCWGANDSAQLGNGFSGYEFSLSTPAMVNGGLTDAVLVSSGRRDSCALQSSGRWSCWGHNAYFQLGDGSSLKALTPITVSELSNVASVSTSVSHSCAVLSSGEVMCLGENGEGQLGDGSAINSYTAVMASGLTDVSAVSVGRWNSCALRDNGSVSCWGGNYVGQLGDGSNTASNIPTAVANLTDAVALSTGLEHSCAIRSDGSLWCWGRYIETNDESVRTNIPVKVSELANVVSVSVSTAHLESSSHSCAVLGGGDVWCWGSNSNGQLGDNSIIDSLVPVRVSDISTAVSVSLGDVHSCAVLSNGGVSCWGGNDRGQLGDGSKIESLVPVTVDGLTNVASISLGAKQSCAVLNDGNMFCWGNRYMGDGSEVDQKTPTAVTALLDTVVSTSVGAFSTCALLKTGNVSCWGANYNGSKEGLPYKIYPVLAPTP